MTDKPERVLALEEAASLTSGSRDADYGPPIINLAASAELKAALRKHTVRPLSGAELEALDMVLTKIGRIITGPKPKRDNYVDAAAYMAIAWEAAKHELDEREIINRNLDRLFHPTGGQDVWPDEKLGTHTKIYWPDPPLTDDEKPSDT